MNAFSVLFYLTHTFDSNLTAKLALVLKEYLLTYFFLHQYALVSAEPSSRWNELSKVLFSLPPKGMFPSAKHCSSDRFSTPKKKKERGYGNSCSQSPEEEILTGYFKLQHILPWTTPTIAFYLHGKCGLNVHLS